MTVVLHVGAPWPTAARPQTPCCCRAAGGRSPTSRPRTRSPPTRLRWPAAA